MIDNLLLGAAAVAEPANLVGIVAGLVLGIVFGAIPGLNSITAVVMIMPFTYGMDPVPAFLALVTSYCGAMYGGSIPAILFRTPGTSAAIVTSIDGYELARKGKAGEALAVSAVGSSFGGFFSVLILILLAPVLADVALAFGPPEYFALAVFGMSIITSIGTKNQVKALIAMLGGVLVATVGVDPLNGMERFTFGSSELMNGVDFVPALTGLFAISEVLRQVQLRWGSVNVIRQVSVKMPPLGQIFRMRISALRAAVIGTVIGLLPGEGATVACVLAYNEERRWSDHPDEFGKGALEGIMAPETANNAVTGGSMVPTLALGIPGSATAAVVMGAFFIQGLTPGPMLFVNNAELVYAIFIGMLLSNVLILLIGIYGVRFVAKAMEIPYTFLGPFVVLFCIWGTFSIRNNLFDVWQMFAFGVLGYYMSRNDFPLVAMTLGIILGPLAEPSLARSLVMFDGNPLLFLTRPITAAILVLSILSLLYPAIQRLLARRRGEVVVRA